jgi:dTDP-4-amino-4,6-dideoxygalactose transaminase
VLCDRRDALVEHLAAHGVGSRRFWFPLHTQAPYNLADDAFPNAVAATQRALWLPSAFTLTDDDVQNVVDFIAAFYEDAAG